MNLENYLYESLLDDEDDMINTDIVDTYINSLRSKGAKNIKKMKDKIYLDEIVSNYQKSRLKDLDDAFFSGYLGSDFNYIDIIDIVGGVEADKNIYPKDRINIDEVGRMNIITYSDSDPKLFSRYSNNINIEKCDYIKYENNNAPEKCTEYICQFLPNSIDQLFISGKHDLVSLSKLLKNKHIKSLHINIRNLPGMSDTRNTLTKESTDIIKTLHSNNKIDKIIVSLNKFKTVDSGNGINITKKSFKLIPYGRGYKFDLK